MELNTLEPSSVFTSSPEFNHQKQSDQFSLDKETRNPIYNDLLNEAGENVVRYLERFNLVQNRNFILLSSVRHYLYGPEELKLVKTIINLKLINQITPINYCLRTMNRALPMKGNFVGCFIDYKSQKNKVLQISPSTLAYLLFLLHWIDNRLIAQIPLVNRVRYIINPRKIKLLTTVETRQLLENNGFLVKDVTEIDGLTYFISQKIKHAKSEKVPLIKLIDFKTRYTI
jgi:hypothetical protein